MLINFSKRSSPTTSHNYNTNIMSEKSTDQLNNGEIFETETKIDDIIVLEEPHEDYVYQVTIKKVYNKQLNDLNNNNHNDLNDRSKLIYGTYKPSNSSFFSYLNDSAPIQDQLLTNNNTKDGLIYTKIKIKQLKYATLSKFIEHLTNQETGQLDSSLVQIFLVTYRTFTDTANALKMIQQRYEQIVPASLEMTEDVRLEHLKSFRSIIYMWLEYYSEDFIDPPEFLNLKELNRFAQKNFTTASSQELLQLIQSKFEIFERISTSKSLFTKSSSNFSNDGPHLPIAPKPKSNHRRSCSNLGVSSMTCDSNNSLQNCATGNIMYLGNTSFSKSQLNLIGYKPPSPLLNLFKKSNSNSSITMSNNLMEANFMSIDSVYFAEQLTFIDKCLFQKICAHLCLGGVWSTRYQKNKNDLNKSGNSTPLLSDKFASIGAFIDQFNVVSFIVQATVLENVELKSVERARIIRKWIEIAQACRNYKNFSSLNAIVQGLNTQCVSRLEKTWNEISFDYKSKFQELTEMFSEDQNQKIFRRILLKEGTAKYADINSGINATLGRKYKETMKKQMKKQEPLGTIPFLGTFLKDLEYINAQNPSKLDKGLINVMQKRKEFEIIAQIKLLQQASQLYNIVPNHDFDVWLHKQTVYSEEQNYKFSNIIEPRNEIDKNKMNSASRSGSIDSLNSNKMSSTNSKYNQTHSRNNSNCVIITEDHLMNKTNGDSSSISNTSNSLIDNSKSSKTQSSNLVVRVNIESSNNINTVLYKTIYVKDSDRTKDVKRSILEKFLQNPETCDKYTLVQVFNNSGSLDSNSNKELVINNNCNVFYAAKSVPNMQFVLRYQGANNTNNTGSISSASNSNMYSTSSVSPTITKGNKANKNIIQNGSRSVSSNASRHLLNELPPQSPNHQQQQNKSNSWKFYKKINF